MRRLLRSILMSSMGSDVSMKYVDLKWIALFVLVLQNSGLVLMMRLVASAAASFFN